MERGTQASPAAVREERVCVRLDSGANLLWNGDVGGPVGHQFPPPFEQVAATVRGLDAVAVHVRQGEFADLARRVGTLGSPVAEA